MADKLSFTEKIYKSKDGKITLYQTPNPPLIVGAATLLMGKALGSGAVYTLLNVISFGALFTWAWLELFSGVNYFRRMLGLIVLSMLIYNRI